MAPFLAAIALIAAAYTPALFPTASKVFNGSSGRTIQTHPTVPQRILSAQGIPLSEPVVQVIMFWMQGCTHCHEVIENVLPAIQERFGSQLEVQLIELVSIEDVDYLQAVAESYNIPASQAVVPLLIIGDHVLIGSRQIPSELPGLIEDYIAQGGVGWPSLPDRSAAAAKAAGREIAPPETGSDGFALAIVILIFMAVALSYSIIAFSLGKYPSMPGWTDWLFPFLIFIGLGAAGYLSYVELQMVDAVCGPVGDCNSVQSSSYARLFGVIPLGMLGISGYLAILAAWVIKRSTSGYKADLAALAVFTMAMAGVMYSLYLTYLEPFVIKAVCMWCLASAIVMTLLLLLSVRPAIQARRILDRSYIRNSTQ